MRPANINLGTNCISARRYGMKVHITLSTRTFVSSYAFLRSPLMRVTRKMCLGWMTYFAISTLEVLRNMWNRFVWLLRNEAAPVRIVRLLIGMHCCSWILSLQSPHSPQSDERSSWTIAWWFASWRCSHSTHLYLQGSRFLMAKSHQP